MSIFICLFFCSVFFFPACWQEKENNKQVAKIAGFIAVSNILSSCGSNQLQGSRLSIETVQIPEDIFDCEDLFLYKFDGRIFSTSLTKNVRAEEIEMNLMAASGSNSLSIPVKIEAFSTMNAMYSDTAGYQSDPSLYNYTEYRASLFRPNGKFSGISAISEESISIAFNKAKEKCKLGITK